MPGLRRIVLLLLIVPLVASCTDTWQADQGLMPTAGPGVEPSSAAPSAPGADAARNAVEPVSACGLIGALITAERGESAAGYREMALTVRNCGTSPYELDGRPQITVLDEDGAPMKIAVVASRHYTVAPKRLVLKPGTAATAVLSWRNTVTNTSGWSETGASLTVATSPDGTPQLVTLPSKLDLGNTGRLEASAWF
ncbi:DUF4232 domain-containing protein [Actinoplanes bogorensis]|uniref:DUF4232 domain-containing protein n=1 Tax=Paractinoplanes bogorensis TaxID=1610840 RepID=A0ABS5Z068_9ACTN|nr:DUF4232 domain-containing protein [Actinoplanes bogorensis]MBU2668373.1 DUF4232 domain-containing protein [Actinoplanes bogorensis]